MPLEYRTGGGLLGRQRTRPMQMNPQGQPSGVRDGRYMQRNEIPLPGERPVAPLWEDVPEGQISYGSNISRGGGGGRAGIADVTNRQVKDPELAQSQLARMLNDNGALLTGARSRADEVSAGRGLLNSSIAAGNAEREAIQAAAPIASQDAAWYGRTAADNMDASNQASLNNADNATSFDIANMNTGASLEQARMRNELEREQNAYNRNFEREGNVWDSEERGRERDFEFDRMGYEDQMSSRERNRERRWQSGESQRGRDFQSQEATRDYNRSVRQNIRNWIMDDPTRYGNPEAIEGAWNFFRDLDDSGEWDMLFDEDFGGG